MLGQRSRTESCHVLNIIVLILIFVLLALASWYWSCSWSRTWSFWSWSFWSWSIVQGSDFPVMAGRDWASGSGGPHLTGAGSCVGPDCASGSGSVMQTGLEVLVVCCCVGTGVVVSSAPIVCVQQLL